MRFWAWEASWIVWDRTTKDLAKKERSESDVINIESLCYFPLLGMVLI
jgi:hypothetical protein